MKKILRKAATLIGKIIGYSIRSKALLRLYNYIFEKSPHAIVNFFVKFVPFPYNDFTWKIKLLNSHTVQSHIDRSNLKTIQFAFSYKWHSPSINKIEHILNQYYPPETPWIDIGANLGLRSLIALSANRPTYFIEPNNELNQLNKDRCELNNFDNYHFLEYGASDQKGEVEFFIDKSSYCSTIEGHLLNNDVVSKKYTIQVDSLDNLFRKELQVFKSAYVKIDVEGHELKTLEGAKEFIEKVQPTLLVEVNTKGDHFNSFYSQVTGLNYEVFEVGSFKKNKILKKINGQNSDENSIKHNDFLLVTKNNSSLLNILNSYTLAN
ncbi:MAG: FkbM family methyltransferase [Bacteroidales bacterium]|nr:FkbM family methyltransferase [Bacteroidales bacterium]